MKRILLVDDDPVVLSSLSSLLQTVGFEVDSATGVPEALRLILSRSFDALLSDLHMPAPGDGLTVVSAMRRAHPLAVTLLLTSFPEMDVAARSIVRQADEILVKPMSLHRLVEAIEHRLSAGPRPSPVIESVATILDHSIAAGVEGWLRRVELDASLMAIPLCREQRTCYLPELLQDLVQRLRLSSPLGSNPARSDAARQHGTLRRHQGYTIPMIVEESRLLQISVFDILQSNLPCVDFSRLLLDVMTIADVIDSQLRQALESYLVLSPADVPVLA